MTPRLMYQWVAADGRVVAQVLQSAKLTFAGPRAVYIARVAGEQVEKERFTCAKRIVDEWLRKNRIAAQAVAA